MKSLFPESLLNQEELSLDVIKAKLNYFELQLHELHWQTTSLAEHLALGDAYENVYDSKDEIVEKMMGYTGTRTKAMSVDTIKNYSPGIPEIIINDLLSFAKRLETYAKFSNMPDVADEAVALSGKIARIKYRFTLS